jgi:hypothetical protein
MTRSANLDFFAAETDQRALLDFLFASTDVRVFESYSRFDAELREFRSTDELFAAFPIGVDQHGNGSAVLLQLWSASVMNDLTIKRIALNSAACNRNTYRHCIEGGALMQLYFGGLHERVITQSHYGHQSQTRAEVWGVDHGVNWDCLKTLSNRIQYHIRKRLAVAKVASCPILPQAYDLARSGCVLKCAVQTPWSYELERVTKLREMDSR